MTEAERARLTDEWMEAHAHEWQAWNGLLLHEQSANLNKINVAGEAGGPSGGASHGPNARAADATDELADPNEVLIAHRAKGDQ